MDSPPAVDPHSTRCIVLIQLAIYYRSGLRMDKPMRLRENAYVGNRLNRVDNSIEMSARARGVSPMQLLYRYGDGGRTGDAQTNDSGICISVASTRAINQGTMHTFISRASRRFVRAALRPV